jgi:hypothetical protein
MSESSKSPPRAAPEPFDLDAYEPPGFKPAWPRPRFDGWTPKRQTDFIAALAECGCVTDACRAVGMSERSAYALRARDDAVSFRNAWETALDFAIRRLSDAVLSRAINGVPRAIFYQGEQIGENRYFNDRLAMFLLRYRDPLRYGKWLDHREHTGHPEGVALDLGAAKEAVREDADLSTREVADRVAQRLDEIAARMEMIERSARRDAGPIEDEDEGDVP